MAGLPKIGVEAVVEGIGNYLSDMNKLGTATNNAADQTEKAAKRSEALGKALQGVGKIIAGLGLTGIFAAAIKEASEMQTQVAQLDAVLKSTGKAAGVTRDQALGLADSFQKVTRYSDDAILSGENMLLTFTNIGKKIFPDATEAVLDMSTALGQDLKSSAIQLGKALQDPIEGVTALRRVGVNLTDAQKALIEQFVKTGQIEKAQQVILKELQTEFGKSAVAAGKTFAGKLDILKNKFNDVLEAVGNQLLPKLTAFLDWVSKIIDQLGPAAPAILEVAAAFGVLTLAAGPLGTALGIILSPIGAIAAAAGALYLAFQTNFLGIRDTVEAALKFLRPIFSGIGSAVQDIIKAITAGVDPEAAFQSLGWEIKHGLEMVFSKLGIDYRVVQLAIDGIQNILQLIGTTISTLWANAQPVLQQVGAGIQGFIKNLGGADFVGAGNLLKQIGAALAGIATVVGDTVIATLGGIGDILPKLGSALKDFVNGLGALSKGDTGAFLDSVGAGITKIGEAALALPLDISARLGQFLGIDVKGGLDAWQGVHDNLVVIVDAIKKKIETAWEDIKATVGSAIWNVKFNLMMTWFAIQANVETAWNGVIAFVNSIVGKVRSAFESITNAIKGALQPVVDFIQNIINKINEITNWMNGHQNMTPPSQSQFYPSGDFTGVHAPGTYVVGTGAQPQLFTASKPMFGIPNIDQVLANVMPQPAPAYAPASSYATTTYNQQQSMGDININGVQGADDAIRRMALLRATGRLS